MKRTCDSCGKTYEAKLSTSRFCSSTCRKRASRGAVMPEVAQLRPKKAPIPRALLSEVVMQELEAADRLQTAYGQAALALAQRIDSGSDTGSAVASLTREFRVTMDAAVAGARVADSPLAQMRDELAERRRRKGA